MYTEEEPQGKRYRVGQPGAEACGVVLSNKHVQHHTSPKHRLRRTIISQRKKHNRMKRELKICGNETTEENGF